MRRQWSCFLVCHIVLTYGVHRSDMGPLGPMASICATLLTDRWMDRLTDGQMNRQTDRQTDRQTNKQRVLGYVISFADWKVCKSKYGVGRGQLTGHSMVMNSRLTSSHIYSLWHLWLLVKFWLFDRPNKLYNVILFFRLFHTTWWWSINLYKREIWC